MSTAEGKNRDAFSRADWLRFVLIVGIGGCVFLLIATGLDSFQPGLVAWLRCAVAALTLWLLPFARGRIERNDWPRVAVLSVLWIAVPFLLFPVAQQWVNSATAGMLNGGIPIAVAVFATLMLRRLPGPLQMAGLATGFAGLALVSVVAGAAGPNEALGVGLMVVAVCFYGVAFNVAAPLQQRYGAVPLLARLLVLATILTTPFGLAGLGSSSFSWLSLGAVVTLGVATAGMFALLADLVGRVGSTRAAVSMYVVPIVALALGNMVRGDQVHPAALLGVCLVIAGAWLVSRRDRPLTVMPSQSGAS